MRLLAVCESPPTLDARHANGSTLITAELLPRLPDGFDIDLVWFADRAAEPAQAVLDRCRSATRLPVRTRAVAAAAQALTRLPRATWQRSGGDDTVRRLAREADVVYLHGLHSFSSARGLGRPLLVHEVDPWSSFWAQRAEAGSGPTRTYDRLQAARARRLEERTSAVASRYLVVNAADAAGLSAQLGRPVEALPNGVDLSYFRACTGKQPDGDVLAFVGTLDYAPNVRAVRELVDDVLPLVRHHRPGVRLLIAGRRPVAAVRQLAGPGIEVLADVPDVRAVYERAAMVVYPGSLGRGTKNTVLEAMATGTPVVCSPEAARALPVGDHARLGRSPRELAEHVVTLLSSPATLARAGAAATVTAAAFRDWDQVSRQFGDLLVAAALSCSPPA